MMQKKEIDVQLVSPSDPEFVKRLHDIDPEIDAAKFIEMARCISSKDFKEIPANASEAAIEAHDRNVDFTISLAMAHDPNTLLIEYYSLHRPNAYLCNSGHFDRVAEMEKDFAIKFGFDPIEAIPDIDKPGLNGMTLLGNAIMLSDDEEKVRRLIEDDGASPDAKCGELTPLEIAEQLGRDKILAYLRDIAKMSA